jgi:hypothetical protein
MLFSFPSIRFGLMVGIGGGIPSKYHDVRLGDIVVSKPTGTFGGIVQYDLGKVLSNGDFQTTGHLNKPLLVLLNGLASLEAEYELGNSKLTEYLTDIFRKNKSNRFKAEYSHQGTENDKLYNASYDHVNNNDTCESCDNTKVMVRRERDTSEPMVYHGTIASANQVVKSAKKRDEIAKKFGALCFEQRRARSSRCRCMWRPRAHRRCRSATVQESIRVRHLSPSSSWTSSRGTRSSRRPDPW